MAITGATRSKSRVMDIEKLRGGAVPQRRFYLTVCHGRLWEAKEEFFDWMEGS